ncbi:unnamed protein product [Musa hybrid cultivar]
MERNRSHLLPSHPIPSIGEAQGINVQQLSSLRQPESIEHTVAGRGRWETSKDTPIMELSTQSFYSLLANTSDSFKSHADVSTGCTVATLRQPNNLPPPKAR